MTTTMLKPVIGAEGPFVSVHIDVSRSDPAGSTEVEVRWRDLRRSLEEQGADPAAVELAGEAVLAPTGVGGECARSVVATASGVLIDRLLPVSPSQDVARWSPVPSLGPLLHGAGREVKRLMVQVDREGADLALVLPGAARPAEEAEVGGGHDELHKIPGGGWSQLRYQRRVEDSMERNAEAVAAEVDRVVMEHKPQAVLLSGDVRVRGLVRASVRQEVVAVLRDVEGSGRADGENHAAAERAVNDVLDAVRAEHRQASAAAFAEHRGQDAGAVDGLAAVAEVLGRGQVSELLLAESSRLNERTLWCGATALELGVSRGDLADPDAARELPAEDAIIFAAISQDAAVTWVLDEELELADGVGASLRWNDASTPHDLSPSMSGDAHRGNV